MSPPLGTLRLDPAFWHRPDVLEALGHEDFRRLFLLIGSAAGESQTRIAAACDLTQATVSNIQRGKHRPAAFDVIKRIAVGLRMPDHARLALGLAPQQPTVLAKSGDLPFLGSYHRPPTLLAVLMRRRRQTYEDLGNELGLSPRHLARLAEPSGGTDLADVRLSTRRALEDAFGYALEQLLDAPSESTTTTDTGATRVPEPHMSVWMPEDVPQPHVASTGVDLDRRELLKAAAVGATSSAARSTAPMLTIVQFFTQPSPPRSAESPVQPLSAASLSRATASAIWAYQDSRYSRALAQLPKLLASADQLTSDRAVESVGVLRAAARAFQLAGSVLLKVDDPALALLAANRSMDAAVRSGDPIALLSSGRLLTHVLLATGHPRAALASARRIAEQSMGEFSWTNAKSVSVYGALLLRAAVAAAHVDDRSETNDLLRQADEAAARLGRDDNAQATAFGPTNVLVHHAHAALLHGDAGTAIDLARRVDLNKLPLAERQAAVHEDLARAYAQWGKHDSALGALIQLEQVAPEELRTRAALQRLISDVAATAPQTTRYRLADLANRSGTSLGL